MKCGAEVVPVGHRCSKHARSCPVPRTELVLYQQARAKVHDTRSAAESPLHGQSNHDINSFINIGNIDPALSLPPTWMFVAGRHQHVTSAQVTTAASLIPLAWRRASDVSLPFVFGDLQRFHYSRAWPHHNWSIGSSCRPFHLTPSLLGHLTTRPGAATAFWQ